MLGTDARRGRVSVPPSGRRSHVAPHPRCVLKVRKSLLRSDVRSTVRPVRTNAATQSLAAERPLGTIGASHAQVLGAVLGAAGLPWNALEVSVQVASAADAPRLDTVVIQPTILGGDPSIRSRYRPAAHGARDQRLVGQAIRGNIAYYRFSEVAVVVPGDTSGASDDFVSAGGRLNSRNPKVDIDPRSPARRTHKEIVS
jgi:hypothetical protein